MEAPRPSTTINPDEEQCGDPESEAGAPERRQFAVAEPNRDRVRRHGEVAPDEGGQGDSLSVGTHRRSLAAELNLIQ